MREHYFGFLWIVFLVTSIHTFAQNNTFPFPQSGPVGIGTTSPLDELHVVGTIRSDGLYSIRSSDGNTAGSIGTTGESGALNGIKIHSSRANGKIVFSTTSGGNSEKMRITQNGNVGIGTNNPSTQLHVVGTIRSDGSYSIRSSDGSSAGSIGTTEESETLNGIRIHSSRANGKIVFSTTSGGNSEKMRITQNGNVGIGTASPTRKLEVAGSSKWTGTASSFTEINSNSNGQYIRQYANDGSSASWIIRGYANNGVQANFNNGGIDVSGTVKAREVNVTNTGWADHVFSPGYPLMGLEELKRYVEEHGHLPGIPTEQEVAENGVNLGEINVKLLEKIEELTLYLLGQQSVIRNQQQRLAERNRKDIEWDNKIDVLESELNELKQLIKTMR